MLTSSPQTSLRTAVSELFPAGYQQAREEFLSAAELAGCHTSSWPIKAEACHQESLAIDVAQWGSPSTTHWLLITSGLHGTEGPFGTAVQLGFLRLLAELDPQHVGVLFLHAMNPFGYSWTRRANENNVDLNRNFLLPGEDFRGAHPLYHHVYKTFDPHRRERFYENFYLRAWLLILKHSKAALQTSLPIGQYDYPEGLFFGGHGPELSQSLLHQNLTDWMPQATEITHLDFHTGLGRWADYRLLIDVEDDHPDAHWFRSWAPARNVECASNNQTAYHARGSFGPWMKQVLFPNIHYRYAGAEFGTYRSERVLHALVNELQTHCSCEPHDARYRRAKRLVSETFVPASKSWRTTTARQGIELCHRCRLAMMEHQ